MGRRISLLGTIVSLALRLAAQDPTSWINFSQDYFRLQVVEDGWYRVTATELQTAGFPSTTVAASQIQLFRRGQEVAIRTQTNTGESTLNYFEFYGERNDGYSDSLLYRAGAQPHTYYNLFTDTATYFLTWSTTSNHKRILNNTQNDNTGLVPKTAHLQKDHVLQVSNYSRGRFLGTNNAFQLAEYDTGEGWTGAVISKNGFQDFTYTLVSPVTGSTELPQVEVVAIGRNSLSHVVTVYAGPNTSSLTVLGNFEWGGYTTGKQVYDIPWNLVGAGGELVVRCVVTGIVGATDNVSFSSVKVTYPQQSNLTVGQNKELYYNPDGSSRYYLQLTSADPGSFTYYDVTDPYTVIRLPQNALTTRSDVVLPMGNEPKTVLAVAAAKQVPVIKSHRFRAISLTNADYLILTHPLLHLHPDGSDPIADYAAYRSSAIGGSYTVRTVDIDQVYDLFHYGEPSPLAIRNLFAAAYQAGVTHALILGKGRTIDQNVFRKVYGDPNELSTSEVFIPTYGVPGGDFPFSIGLDATRPLIPAIAIGRINAWKPEQVTDYLSKVIEMEAVPFDELWRKNLIQLSGGTTDTELNLFSGFIDDFKRIAEGDYLGGNAMNQGKRTSEVSEQFDISTEVNSGVGFITLFGHSSSTVTDVEIGKPSNPDFNYQNKGKYPFILVNGCRAGEIFGNAVSFGEDWITYPEKGAIGFIAHADQASSINLKVFSSRLYEVGFADTLYFGKTIGEVMQETCVRYYQSGSNESHQTQVQETLYQGDPAIAYFRPDKPDFHLLADKITANSITGDQLLAQQDSFLLQLPISNYGRSTRDTMNVMVTRTFPRGDQLIETYQVLPPRYNDTLEIYLRNPPELELEGDHQLVIQLDPANQIEELNELNNSATIAIYISSGSTQHLLPYDQAIAVGDTVVLAWQLTDPLEGARDVTLQYDTVSLFNSLFLKSRTLFGENLMLDTLALESLPDSTVIYWRTRFAQPDSDEDTIWSTSSFTLLASGSPGWGQFSLSQFAKNELTGLVADDTELKVAFETTIVPLELRTSGTDSYAYDNLGIYVNEGNLLATINTIDPVCLPNTFNALFFDRNTAQLKRPIAPSNIDVFDPLICGRLPQMIYNLTPAQMLTNRRIEQLIAELNFGDQAAFFNIDSVAYSSFDAAIVAALGEIGVDPSQLAGVVDGQPLVIFGVKGMGLGEATVLTTDGSGLPVRQQTINYGRDVIGTANQGTYTTPMIGPATAWGQLNSRFGLSGSDYVDIEIFGRSRDGVETLLVPQTDLGDIFELNTIDANLYPYIYLTLILGDAPDLTPPDINELTVSFMGSPEGILIPAQKTAIELQEGQELSSGFSFINIGDVDFQDSISFSFQLRNVSSDIVQSSVAKVGPLASGDTVQVPYEINTLNLKGQNALIVKASSADVERVSINNQIVVSNFAEIEEEAINPLLDVTVDGRYILDGEIVSANPIIRIALKDENPFLIKTDTTGLDISIKYPTGDFNRVSYSQSAVNWSPATADQPFEVTYNPQLDEDGIYTLRVRAQDESGNLAGQEPYEISFEVINQSTITHFYPYPNPFSTSCRFVFTVTGSVVPDNLLIQIMTISGRVVKNIDEQELGPIHIGNNISDYVWDGTDDYGDKLANGVYLYKVTVRSQGQSLEHRATSADQAFKRGFGKLYILR